MFYMKAWPYRTIVRFPSLKESRSQTHPESWNGVWTCQPQAQGSKVQGSEVHSERLHVRCDRWRSAAPRKMQIAVDLLIFCGYKGATRLNKQIEVW